MIGSAIAAVFGGLMLLPLAVLAGIYLGFSIGFSLGLAKQHGWGHMFRLPLAFACMHFAYGLGFLSGLLRRSFGRAVAVPKEAEAP